MNRELSSLTPHRVWNHFERILSIPHPSYHEEGIKEYLKGFAASQSLECIEDEAGNILIRKPATNGMEGRKGVILQAHMDMVAQKNGDKQFDFTVDPIVAYIDGDWVRADGTTLGADNGLGIAAALAILEQDGFEHGDIEVLLTSNEESGMDGAFGLSEDLLRGEILLNLDSEDEHEICIGCAGGLMLDITFEHQRTPAPREGYSALRLEIRGLRGGHSGCDIDQQRGNANKLLFRFLRLTKLDLMIIAAQGGTLHNAIPREGYVDLLIHSEDLPTLRDQVESYLETLNAEFEGVENSISLTLSEIEYPDSVIDDDCAARLVWAVAASHDGVYRMSNSMKGLVQSSSNLAVVKCEKEHTQIEVSVRSSIESEKIALADAVASTFELADAEVACSGGYPGWTPNPTSLALGCVVEAYRELYGAEPHVNAVHAGLECGLIGSKYPKMEMVSFGPTINSPHSPDECAQISSVERFYALLERVISTIPNR